MPTRQLALLLTTLFLVAGCKVGPNFDPPQRPMPTNWLPPTTAPTTQNASVTTSAPADVARWWGSFNDPVLDSLIARAVESNLDLKQAEARLRQARAQRGVVAAGFWPQANVNGSYRRQGSDSRSVQTTVGGVVRSSGGSSDLFQGGLDAAWELDVFGGIRRDIEAATADIAAAIEDRRDVLVTITSEVALNYIDLRSFQRRIAIAQENLQSQIYSADLTHRRQRGGFVSGLDAANADAQVATTRSQIPILRQSARQTIYNIALLLGREPAALVAQLDSDAPIPPTPADVPIGLPSDLLRRRPDIRRAEQQIHAATARIGVATADLFPRFSLTGSLSSSGENLRDVPNWNNAFWSIGPSVSWPIFSAGSIRSNIAVTNAIEEQAAITYEQTVLTALRDVESALVAYGQEQQHRAALIEAVAANRKALDLAQTLYNQGQTGFLDVLTAERSLYASQDALAQSDATMATNLIALFKALGGGWEFAEPTTRPGVID
jgi:NodT family efflux transporter outer membrane factor (OMF) lipoprotein